MAKEHPRFDKPDESVIQHLVAPSLASSSNPAKFESRQLNLQYDRQHDGPLAGFLVEMAAQRGADFFLDDAPVADFLGARFLDGLVNHFSGAFEQFVRLVERNEPA